MRIVCEPEFHQRIQEVCEPLRGRVFSVVGPGRSGAVASVYASHYLGIAWIPYMRQIILPAKLQPILLIDTARCNGKTLRKATNRLAGHIVVRYLYNEPPMVRFFYEAESHRRAVNRSPVSRGITARLALKDLVDAIYDARKSALI